MIDDFLTSWTSFKKKESGVIFTCQTHINKKLEVHLDIIFNNVLRIRMSPKGIVDKKSPMLVKDTWSTPYFSIKRTKDSLNISTKELSVNISRNPWRMYIKDNSKKTVFCEKINDKKLGDFEVLPIGYSFEKSSFRVRETIEMLPEENFYGFGESFSPLNKRGLDITSWTTDALSVSSPRFYKSVPFFMSSRGYGVFVHSSYRIKYYMGSRSFISYTFEIEDHCLDYFFIYGPSIKDIIKRYCDLTGYAPVPPKWSFGLWMSRYGYHNRVELETVCKKLRERDIPCDVVHLDPFWLGPFVNGKARRWCVLEWDKTAFPEPEKMIAKLKKDGFKISLWENPYVPIGTKMYEEGKKNGYFVKRKDGSSYLIDGWAGVKLSVVDFTNEAAVKWYQEKHVELFKMGISVFKTDFGEAAPEDGIYRNRISGKEAHNIYPLLYNKAVFEITDKFTKGKGIVWARSAYAGSQRYPVHWGGDCLPTFDHMACQLRGGLSLGLSGIPFYSHDIGGFEGESNPTLYIRWAQFGLFSSHSRCHGTTPREPWEFGKKAETIFRKYAKLRYRLIPYIYSYCKIAFLTGLPLMRPLILEYQDDPNVTHMDLEYLLGEYLLVAPVFSELLKRKIYLPRGEWIDYWNKKVYSGPKYITYEASLDILPLFVRGGAIIPMCPAVDYITKHNTLATTFDIYATSPKGEFVIYDEDVPPVKILYKIVDRDIIITLKGSSIKHNFIINSFEIPRKIRINDDVINMNEQSRLERHGIIFKKIIYQN